MHSTLGVGGKRKFVSEAYIEYNIKMNSSEVAFEGVDSINLVHDRVRWLASLERKRNFGFHKRQDNNFILLSEQLSHYQERFCPM
jgi:hypothetical protein